MNEYLRIGVNVCNRSCIYPKRFHCLIEGYLHQSNTIPILSRVTDPMYAHIHHPPPKSVNDGRSIQSSTHSISLRIVNVFHCSFPFLPCRVYILKTMDCNLGKSESSIHPFYHSQTQSNEQKRMQNYQVRLIVVEEDL